MVRKIAFHSQILETATYFLIAAPDGADFPLPAVVLFRGVPEEWLNEGQDDTRGGRTLLTVMDDLIRAGQSAPLAFILPRTANRSQTGFVSYGTALRPDLLEDRSFLGTCRMDDFLDQEILPKAFESGLVARDRVSIDGFSLGGAAAIQHALRRSDVFRSCGCYDGALLEYAFDNVEVTPDTPSDLRFDGFPYLYGNPPDEAAFRAVNALDVVGRGDFRMPPSMIHYASERAPAENGWRVRAFLERSGIDNQAEDPTMSPESAHAWWWADEHLYRTLPFHSRVLADDRE
jgi:S-formylglutathione hydrolase FrmB